MYEFSSSQLTGLASHFQRIYILYTLSSYLSHSSFPDTFPLPSKYQILFFLLFDLGNCWGHASCEIITTNAALPGLMLSRIPLSFGARRIFFVTFRSVCSAFSLHLATNLVPYVKLPQTIFLGASVVLLQRIFNYCKASFPSSSCRRRRRRKKGRMRNE